MLNKLVCNHFFTAITINTAATATSLMTKSVEVEEENTEDDNTDACDLPVERGSCNGNLQRYFFNSTSGQCTQFTFGGCGGNRNNFMTEEYCQQRCEQVDGRHIFTFCQT